MNADYLNAGFDQWAERNVTSVSILGAGWHGFPLAVRLANSGLTVKAATTTSSKIPAIAIGGVIPYLLNLDNPELHGWQAFLRADALVISLPPSVLYPALKSLIRLIQSSPIRRIVFISSTAVYPDEPGVYSESMAVHRVSKHSGIDLFELENAFRNLEGREVSVLRFGGLFGPNRHPAGFFSYGRIVPDPDGNVNMLHLEDAVNAVICTLYRSGGGDVYNVCSPDRVSRKDFYSKAFALAGIPLAGFGESRGHTRIIASNEISEKLHFEFCYSSALEALNAL